MVIFATSIFSIFFCFFFLKKKTKTNMGILGILTKCNGIESLKEIESLIPFIESFKTLKVMSKKMYVLGGFVNLPISFTSTDPKANFKRKIL